MASQVLSLSRKDSIIEEREEIIMVSHLETNKGYVDATSTRIIAHFLKPIAEDSPEHHPSSIKLPLLSPTLNLSLNLGFKGMYESQKLWEKWVDKMSMEYSLLWDKVGILEAICGSKYKFERDDGLVCKLAERYWSIYTNTFVFPWGEASITLEDMMILGGFSVVGNSILHLSQLEENNYNLLDVETYLTQELKTLEHYKNHTHVKWIAKFMSPKSYYQHEGFLVSWLSRFVFPVHEITKINKNIFRIAIHLARGTKIALAPAVLASIYRDLSSLKILMMQLSELEEEATQKKKPTFTLGSPLVLVQIWAWERFQSFKLKPKSLNPGDPRIVRWHDIKRLEIENLRTIIDHGGETFIWRPYCLSLDNWWYPKFYMENEDWVYIGRYSNEELECFVRCLRVCVLVGLDCEETYQPHRVAMQFGYDQDLPAAGHIFQSHITSETAWINYSKPLSNDELLYFPSRLSKSGVSKRYLEWWQQQSISASNNSHPSPKE